MLHLQPKIEDGNVSVEVEVSDILDEAFGGRFNAMVSPTQAALASGRIRGVIYDHANDIA